MTFINFDLVVPDCRKTFRRNNRLQSHMERVYLLSEKPFGCLLCHKRCAAIRDVLLNLIFIKVLLMCVHTSKNLECLACAVVFRDINNLRTIWDWYIV